MSERMGWIYQKHVFELPPVLEQQQPKHLNQAKAKYAALKEWVNAVNQHGGFGTWKSAISTSTTDIGEQIAKAAQVTNSSTSSSPSSPS